MFTSPENKLVKPQCKCVLDAKLSAKGICSVSGCNSLAVNKGLCKCHYHNVYNGSDIQTR